jgi:uncharacterized membrane protein YtjA (UPF0391 family)
MKKIALAMIAAAAAVFGFGVVAEAQTGPYGGTGTATVSSPVVVPGGTVTITVTGCTPGEIVTFRLGPASATAPCTVSISLGSVVIGALVAQTPGTGTATATLPVPTTPGNYTGTATAPSGFSASFAVAVQVTSPPATGLPATGSGGIDTTTGIALGLFVVGLGLFAASQVRLRRRPVTI